MSFWDVVWFIIISFAFVAYLMVMFSILTDLFRDRETGGFAKAVWVIALIFLPFLTALVYLIARGHGMADRSAQEAKTLQKQQEAYIRDVAGKTNPVDQVAQARKMLDAGEISQSEYERLKEKALA
jgi:hypothetical protein